MKSFITVSFVIMALFAVNVLSAEESEGDGSLGSTLKITLKLCFSAKNQESVPAAFFACYEEPSKTIFVKCQQQAFAGKTLNTLENINYACLRAWKLGAYATCLGNEFTAAGLNQTEAVTAVNKCQWNVVGL